MRIKWKKMAGHVWIGTMEHMTYRIEIKEIAAMGPRFSLSRGTNYFASGPTLDSMKRIAQQDADWRAQKS